MGDEEEDIAVIGIGCNFPGGEGLDCFWKVLLEGKNCSIDIPVERFDVTFWCDSDETKPGKTQTTRAALIDGIDEFDCKFFGVSEVEADYMDPQQKLLLQCTYRALEDAGIAMERISGSRTGVYIGLMNRDYEMLRNNSASTITHYNSTGSAMSIAANRISYTFNLTGPSFAIDSACSSSLVALHLACQAIKQGDCEMALCGGVNCIIEPRVFVALSKARMISAEGTSRPFSGTADGYGRGEGCGVVLLKILKKAKEDGNKIWGLITKTAVNQDGHCAAPITKPSIDQQEELLRQVYSNSDIAHVQYIEAHGTGTPVGDPTEMRSISNAIAKKRPSDSETLLVGSVKGNIGHTESAAGVAGLIKVLLMMKHETIVPSVFFSEDSTSMDVKSLNLNIPVKVQRWKTNGLMGRMAGINSFGFGGTNSHVILREFTDMTCVSKTQTHCPNVFVISAATERSLILSISDTQQRLRSDPGVDTKALSYTSACGRSHHKHTYRKVFSFSSLSELERNLASALKTKVESTISNIQVVFVFCGNGVTYRGMCRQLMRKFSAFREKVREVEAIFHKYSTINISKQLAGEAENQDFSKPNVAQPLLFAIQVGIATLLKHWGIKPDATLGHSVGEVAAAHCSGLLSLEDAVKVLYNRSTCQNKAKGGKMLVVCNVDIKKVANILPVFSGKVCIAAFNSPLSCTLSGDAEAIDVLHQRLRSTFTDENIFLHVLDVPAAYHSHMMDSVMADIENSIYALDANNMECKLFSTVTGERYSDGDFTSGRYWAKNVRDPVLFEQALKAVIRDKSSRGNVVFVEIGPRRVLHRNIIETLGRDTVVLSSTHTNEDRNSTLVTVSKLFELGVKVNWHHLYKGCETVPVACPVYQFDNTRRKLNFESLRKGEELSMFAPHPLVCRIKHNEFVCNFSAEEAQYLWEHKINHVPVVPGAFYVELAFASVMANLKPKVSISQLHLSVQFESVLTLNSTCQKLRVTLEHREKETSFKIQSTAATHAFGTYRCTESEFLLEESNIHLDMITQRCKLVLMKEEIYSILALAGFEYGPLLRQLDRLYFGNEFNEAVTVVQVPGELLECHHDYFIHPVLLDYFLQMTAVLAMGHMTAKQGFPSGIGSIVISGPLQEEMVIYMKATQQSPDHLDVCGCLSSLQGNVLVELTGVRIAFLCGSSSFTESSFFHNETNIIAAEQCLQTCKMKAIIFEDELGIARRLKAHVFSEAIIVERKQHWKSDQIRDFVIQSLNKNVDIQNILFMWGMEDLSHLTCEQVLDHLVTCCEMFRQTVLGLKESKRVCAVHVITYRSTEKTVDRVSSGFVLSGMLRACAAEMPEISFQLVDFASVTNEDVQMLAHVINTCKQQDIVIDRGQVSATTIARTSMQDIAACEDFKLSMCRRQFALQTNDPYKMCHLSATSADTNERHIVPDKSVEIQLASVCMHTADYFPASSSHWDFGKTMYWSKHTSHNHKLLALDFSGVVTAVGKHVRGLRVGDHVASCYPVVAMKKIRIPEGVCFSTRTLPFLREIPCVSYYILAWSIMQEVLSAVLKQQRRLCIITSNSASVLTKVLALTANRSGWKVSSLQHFSQKPSHFDDTLAFIFLPPFHFTPPWQEVYESGESVKHLIFVCSSHMAPEGMFASKCDHVHVHNIDMRRVLQKANLLAQNKNILSWLQSMGFGTSSLPLGKEVYHSSGMVNPQNTTVPESYFTTNTVRQVVLDNGKFNHPASDIPLLTKAKQLFRPTCVYIVTGGLSGLGLETVKFIAQNGGCCIVTLSRRIMPDEKQFELHPLQKMFGVSIMHLQCDVSVSTQVVGAISKIGERFPSCSIKGVFHSAAVLHDALIEVADETLFRKVLQPKVLGALNLHYATLHNKLDFFVCYSSISAFIGNASQTNYAAANSFLDLFCHYRRNLGLAGQSINWGPVNLGLLLNRSNVQQFLEAKGMVTMNVCEVHETLKKGLLMNRPQQVICKFNFQNLNIHILSQNKSLRERLSPLVEAELRELIGNEPTVPHGSCASEKVREIVSIITNVNADELDDDATMAALGIDSMLAMTLQNRIFQEIGVNIPLITLLDPNCTLTKLVQGVSGSG